MIASTDAVTVWKLSSTAVAVLISSLRDGMIRSETGLYPKTQNGWDPKWDCSLIKSVLSSTWLPSGMSMLCSSFVDGHTYSDEPTHQQGGAFGHRATGHRLLIRCRLGRFVGYNLARDFCVGDHLVR